MSGENHTYNSSEHSGYQQEDKFLVQHHQQNTQVRSWLGGERMNAMMEYEYGRTTGGGNNISTASHSDVPDSLEYPDVMYGSGAENVSTVDSENAAVGYIGTQFSNIEEINTAARPSMAPGNDYNFLAPSEPADTAHMGAMGYYFDTVETEEPSYYETGHGNETEGTGYSAWVDASGITNKDGTPTPNAAIVGDIYSYNQVHEQDDLISSSNSSPYSIISQFRPPHASIHPSSSSNSTCRPISALAFDSSVSAAYVATHSTKKRRIPHHSSVIKPGLSTAIEPSYNGSAMISVHTLSNGMCYSSFAAHPLAPTSVLQSLSNSTFGSSALLPHDDKSISKQGIDSAAGGSIGGRLHRVPAHAYCPPFSFPLSNALSSKINPVSSPTLSDWYAQGIGSVLPFPFRSYSHSHNNNNTNDEGFVCSISPGSVRLHSRGGLLLSETPTDLVGMQCGAVDPSSSVVGDSSSPIFLTVGGMDPMGNTSMLTAKNRMLGHLNSIDVTAGMKVVSSAELLPQDQSSSSFLAASDIQSNPSRNSIVVGCTDGTLRFFDGTWRMRTRRSRFFSGSASSASGNSSGGAETAKVKGHVGGITSVAVSEDGNLVCTAGYSSRPTSSSAVTGLPYAFPDQHILIYDVRLLGRGPMAHPFSGVRGGPRLVAFLPGDTEKRRVLVASGQSGGGLQVITPFQNSDTSSSKSLGGDSGSLFLQPNLEPGERMTAMALSGQDVAIGTSFGAVQIYRAKKGAETSSTSSIVSGRQSSSSETEERGGRDVVGFGVNGPKKPELVCPPYVPAPPPLSIDPRSLLNQPPDARSEDSSISKSIFNEYVLMSHPAVSSVGGVPYSQALSGSRANKLITPARRMLSKQLSDLTSSKTTSDFVSSVPTSDIGLNLLGLNESPSDANEEILTFLNPNRLLFSKSALACYDMTADPRKRTNKREPRRKSDGDGPVHIGMTDRDDTDNEAQVIPLRYQRTVRPPYSIKSPSDYARHNDTGLWPGWDYPPAMPNSFACPVLLLLYFVPEIRLAVLQSQLSKLARSGQPRMGSYYNPLEGDSPITSASGLPSFSPEAKGVDSGSSLLAELGFVFDQIDSLSAQGFTHAASEKELGGEDNVARVGAFVPSNFLAAFSSLPEASALALLDGAPAAVEYARRPEAFHRFLVHILDSELVSSHPDNIGQSTNPPNEVTDDNSKLIDSLQGIDFTSVNEFVTGSGPPTESKTRVLTIDLSYDPFLQRSSDDESLPQTYFGDVLRHALSGETRLRAWCKATRSYETVVQRKIATSLPKILSLSCCCGGTKDAGGLNVWRNNGLNKRHWLPEIIEIQLHSNGDVIVREFLESEMGEGGEWKTFSSKHTNSAMDKNPTVTRKVRYRLDAVVSFIRSSTEAAEDRDGHHVVHMRTSIEAERRALKSQRQETKVCEMKAKSVEDHAIADTSMIDPMTLNSGTPSEVFQRRCVMIDNKLEGLDDAHTDRSDGWILANGFVVSSTMADDARAFHVDFKEPCIVLFREIDDEGNAVAEITESNFSLDLDRSPQIPEHVMNAPSISGFAPSHRMLTAEDLPENGDLVAIDTEFVSVQHEESVLTATGSKVTIREGRNALARMSVIDCQNGQVIIDDYVLPREPVVDYLTRFSGIRHTDLDPGTSPHNLVTMDIAYLKLRFLLDRGCIFVGHGLNQDFLIVNLVVPPSQIIDTVEIFHQDKRRFISLRFLANYLLGHDMQQDTHDSVEDAKAAYRLYAKARDLKRRGLFEKTLVEVYDIGQRTDWKLGLNPKSIIHST